MSSKPEITSGGLKDSSEQGYFTRREFLELIIKLGLLLALPPSLSSLLSACSPEEGRPPPSLLKLSRDIEDGRRNLETLIDWVLAKQKETSTNDEGEEKPPIADPEEAFFLNQLALVAELNESNSSGLKPKTKEELFEALLKMTGQLLLPDGEETDLPVFSLVTLANALYFWGKLPEERREALREDFSQILETGENFKPDVVLQWIAEIEKGVQFSTLRDLLTDPGVLAELREQSTQKEGEIAVQCLKDSLRADPFSFFSLLFNPRKYEETIGSCTTAGLRQISFDQFLRDVAEKIDKEANIDEKEWEEAREKLAETLGTIWGIDQKKIKEGLLPLSVLKELKRREIGLQKVSNLKFQGEADFRQILTEGVTTLLLIFYNNLFPNFLSDGAVSELLRNEIAFLRDVISKGKIKIDETVAEAIESCNPEERKLISEARLELIRTLAEEIIARALEGSLIVKYSGPSMPGISTFPFPDSGNMPEISVEFPLSDPEKKGNIYFSLFGAIPYLKEVKPDRSLEFSYCPFAANIFGRPEILNEIKKGGILVSLRDERVGGRGHTFLVPSDTWNSFEEWVAQVNRTREASNESGRLKYSFLESIEADTSVSSAMRVPLLTVPFELVVPFTDTKDAHDNRMPMAFLFIAEAVFFNDEENKTETKPVAIFKDPTSPNEFYISWGPEKDNYARFSSFEVSKTANQGENGEVKVIVRTENGRTFRLFNLPAGWYTQGLNKVEDIIRTTIDDFVWGVPTVLQLIISSFGPKEKVGWVETVGGLWNPSGACPSPNTPIILVASGGRKGNNIGYPMGTIPSPPRRLFVASDSDRPVAYDTEGNPYVILSTFPSPLPPEIAQMPDGFRTVAALIQALRAKEIFFALPLGGQSIFREYGCSYKKLRGITVALVSELLNLAFFSGNLSFLWKAIARTGLDPGLIPNLIIYKVLKRLHTVPTP